MKKKNNEMGEDEIKKKSKSLKHLFKKQGTLK